MREHNPEDWRFDLIHDAVAAEEEDQFSDRQQFLVDLETVAVELIRIGQHGLAESLRYIARRNA